MSLSSYRGRIGRSLLMCLFGCAVVGAAHAAPTPQFFTYYALGADFQEARDHVNLQWAVSWTGDREAVKAQLREAKAAGVKAMLQADFIFFDPALGSSPRSDGRARWHAFAAELAAEDLLGTVIAVYPLDEPDVAGVADGDMQAVIAAIHEDPLTRDKKVAGLFSVDIAKLWGGHYRITGREHTYGGSLRAYDWVGFDCYGCGIFTETAWDTLTWDWKKPGLVRVPGPTLYDNFKSQLDLGRQQVILVPQGAVGGPPLAPVYDDPIAFYQRAATDRDVVLLLPFTWLDQPGAFTGVRSIPALQAAYRAIGKDIDAHHPEVSPFAPPTALAVEFYNPERDHYFVSADAGEIRALDTGALAGWVRTGESWRVFLPNAATQASGSPVCRLYGRPEAGLDSHFYSASPAECATVLARFPNAWILESDDVFQVLLPDAVSGSCPLLTVPVYRLYDSRPDANHRFTTSALIQAAMAAKGWVPEGYGANAVAMCVPL